MTAKRDYMRMKSNLRYLPRPENQMKLDADIHRVFSRGEVTRDQAEAMQKDRIPGFFDRRTVFVD